MIQVLRQWIRRLAQGKSDPLPEPSIGTRGTLPAKSAAFLDDLKTIQLFWKNAETIYYCLAGNSETNGAREKDALSVVALVLVTVMR